MRFYSFVAAAALLSASLAAHADSFSATAVPLFTIPGTADTLSFGATSSSFTSPGSVTQAGSVGSSITAFQGLVNFSFNDTFTVDGVTKMLTIQGTDNVQSTSDIISILASGPVSFGSQTFSLLSSSATVSGFSPTSALNLNATIAPATIAPTPEPSSLALLGTGILGVAGVIRKRLG